MTLRTAGLPIILSALAFAQGDPVAARLQQAESILSSTHARAKGPGWDLLHDLVRECDSVQSPPVSCAEAWDWYGTELKRDHKPDAYYRKALEVAERLSAPDPIMVLALELESMVLSDSGDTAKARELWLRAFAIRQRIVASIGRPASDPICRVGGGVKSPSVTRKVDPAQSEIGRLFEVSGKVVLAIVVGSDGEPHRLRLIKGLGFGLDEQAAQALLQWRFKPAAKAGSPVNVAAQVELNFRPL